VWCEERFDHLGRVARLDADDAIREAVFEFAQHAGQDMLRGGRAGAEAQAALAPFTKPAELGARCAISGEDALGMREECSPAWVSTAFLPILSKMRQPTSRSSAFIECETADWLKCSSRAALRETSGLRRGWRRRGAVWNPVVRT
jgi:hypothetical protein